MVVLEDEIVLVGRPEHPISLQKELHLSDLQGFEVVQREKGSGTHEVVEQALLKEGVMLTVALEATAIEAVKEAVLGGTWHRVLCLS